MFLNRLKTCFYENGISIVAQANNARNEAYRNTLAIQALAAKCDAAESHYKFGQHSAEDYLKLAASHFDNDKIIEILRITAEEDEKEAAAIAASGSNQSSLDDREMALAEDEDLSDMDEGSWESEDWTQQEGKNIKLYHYYY